MAKQAKGQSAGAREWAERIEGWRASGQAQVKYCADQELSVSGLRKWIVKLGSGRSRPRAGRSCCRYPCALSKPVRQALGVGTGGKAAFRIKE